MVDVGTLLQNAGFLEDGNLRAIVMCTVISRREDDKEEAQTIVSDDVSSLSES